MGMSTRSKTGSATPSVKPIISKRAAAPASRKPKGKKGPTEAAPAAGATGGRIGAPFPAVSLFDHTGTLVNTADLLTDAHPALILFLYPRANTPGCTTQACGLRDAYELVQANGYSVFGLSYDKPGSQAGWKAKHSLPYGLLCDTLDIGLIKMLGAHKPPKSIKRSLFVVGRDQKGDPVILKAEIGVSPKDSIAMAREYVEKNPIGPVDDSKHIDKPLEDNTDDDKAEGETIVEKEGDEGKKEEEAAKE